jgi:hypothetical protein
MSGKRRTAANTSVAGELGFEPRQTESESASVADIAVHKWTRQTVTACKTLESLIDKQS